MPTWSKRPKKRDRTLYDPSGVRNVGIVHVRKYLTFMGFDSCLDGDPLSSLRHPHVGPEHSSARRVHQKS